MMLRNRRGMYEFVLTKSIMLIFILGLMTIFWYLSKQFTDMTANEIAQLEAKQIATIIDNAIGFKGMGTTKTYQLKMALMVGNDRIGYDLRIVQAPSGRMAVVVKMVTAPHKGVEGIATFGFGVAETEAYGELECKWENLNKEVRELVITKGEEWNAEEICPPPGQECPDEEKRLFIIKHIKLNIDADGCTSSNVGVEMDIPENQV